MFIGYDRRGGCEYAKICKSERVDGKVKTTQVHLGKVVDKEKGVYMNRSRGLFTYDLATNTYGVPDFPVAMKAPRRANAREKLCLDFGDAFFVDSYARKIGMMPAIDAMKYGNHDSVRALEMFYILYNKSNTSAMDWFEGSYARVLYPEANLCSQVISNILASIGSEESYRAFFAKYFKLLIHREGKEYRGEDILIDSTGLPNSNHLPLTAISNHNGEISNEMRLIYVVQQGSNMPLFMRYVPGNVIDVSTLIKTILELKALNVETKFAILDAGYITRQNAEDLYRSRISFVSRLQENRSLYRELIEKHLPTLCVKENMVAYNARYAFVKRVRCELVPGHSAYAYVGKDLAAQSAASPRIFAKAQREGQSEGEVFDRLATEGLFILISSRPVAIDRILPLYYTRAQIEQVFDVCKHDTNMLPLRVHQEETLRGHLLLTFAAAAIRRKLQEDLKESQYTPENTLFFMRNQKCKVYDGYVLTAEAEKKQNDIYKLFGLTVADRYNLKVACS